MKACPRCQRRYPDDFQFCPEDGGDLEEIPRRRRKPLLVAVAVALAGILVVVSRQACQRTPLPESSPVPAESFTLPDYSGSAGLAKMRSEVERLYQRSEQGLAQNNLEEYFCYMDTSWSLQSDGESEETLEQARSAFRAPRMGERVVQMRRKIADYFPRAQEGWAANLWVKAATTSGRELRYKQTDLWIVSTGGPLCYSSRKGSWEGRPEEEGVGP
jgi:predicted nucleic acid-binding Zn ribbon protein